MQVGVGGAEHASQEGTATNVRVGGGGGGVGIVVVVVGVVWMEIGLMARRPSALLGRSVVNHNLLTSSSSSRSCSSTTIGPSRHAATTTATTTTAVNPIDTADESSRRCPSTVATTHAHARSETAASLTQCRSQGIVQRAGGTGPVLLVLPPRMRGRDTARRIVVVVISVAHGGRCCG